MYEGKYHMKEVHILDGENWTLTHLSGPSSSPSLPSEIPATVPGCVHSDLLSAQIIGDPFVDNNEAHQLWIGQSDWQYSRVFELGEDAVGRWDLCFDGLDTIASIYLNGQLLLKTQNMFRSYRSEVTELLIPGQNLIEVKFSSPVFEANARSEKLGYRPAVNHHPYNAVRKMASSFGWDWGIDTSTSGIWKSVRLEKVTVARISNLRTTTKRVASEWVLDVELNVDLVLDTTLNAEVIFENSTLLIPLEQGVNRFQIDAKTVKNWEPIGSGEPNLYQLSINIFEESELVESFVRSVGFREVVVRNTKDAEGTGFELEVNSQLIYIRGVNWIPADSLVSRVSPDLLRNRLSQAKAAGVNLIRVWGGGVYESDDFYQICDELGLMVWQDFLFACAAYSEDPEMWIEVEAEARENIVRLGSHPSLVLLNGNNENLWGHESWGWKDRLQGKTWGGGYYYQLLPSLVEELAPHVCYTPGSPYSPESKSDHNNPSDGSCHIWDVWNEKDYSHYLSYQPRFVAEFGWQAPASLSTIKSSISDVILTPTSPGMQVHQKAMSGNDKLIDGLVPHFTLPEKMSDWHWAMQLNQALAIGTALGHFRASPKNMGSIIWQLNDNWPVTSWAMIDSEGVEKPAYWAMANFYSDQVAVFTRVNGSFQICLSNESSASWVGEAELRLLSITGEQIDSQVIVFDVKGHSRDYFNIKPSLAESDSSQQLFLRLEIGDHAEHHFFHEYKELDLLEPTFESALHRVEGGYVLELTPDCVVRDLLLLVDKLDYQARLATGLTTLLPGERVEIPIQSSQNLELVQFLDPEVLRHGNQLVAEK